MIKIVDSLANNTGKSLVQLLKSPGDIEAAYRFTRNPAIKAQMIAEAGFKATAEKAKACTKKGSDYKKRWT